MAQEDNYLTYRRGAASWIFTLDHKRIGVMYLISVLVAFFLGGVFAMLIRTQLLKPEGLLFHGSRLVGLSHLQPDVHAPRGGDDFPGADPRHPAALGNFVLPIMLGAKDVAFPRLNLWSYYLYVIGAVLALASIVLGGGRYRLDLLHAVQHANQRRGDSAGLRGVHPRVQFDFHGHELHRDDPHAASAGHDLVPHAAVPLGAVRHGHHPGPGHAGAGDHAVAADSGAAVPPGHLRLRTTAAIRSCSSISSGSTRIRRSTS